MDKLHLGCGEKYLEGYENVDFPSSEHTVMKVRADRYEDIGEMERPENSYVEIRSHHLFEHFTRAKSLQLLLRWRKWLRPDGELMIETPDFGLCAEAYTYAFTLRRRLQLGRHMLGSQEAAWANHYDFWDASKFRFVLRELGFKDIRIYRYRNSLAQRFEQTPLRFLRFLPIKLVLPLLNFLGGLIPESYYEKHGGHKLPNILVRARKGGMMPNEVNAVRKILSMYLVGREGDDLLAVWMKEAGF